MLAFFYYNKSMKNKEKTMTTAKNKESKSKKIAEGSESGGRKISRLVRVNFFKN